MKILSPRIHGVLDYVVVALFALAPTLFAFSGLAAIICYVLAVAHLGMSIITRYPLSLAKLVPFPIHGIVEVVVTLLLLVAPWLFGFDNAAAPRIFFLASGVGIAFVWLLTDYRAAESPVGASSGRDLHRPTPA